MKINYIIILVSFLLFNCSSENSDEMIDSVNRLAINNVSPSRVKIGDTIRISGNRLDLIEKLVFFNEKQTHPNDQPFNAPKHYFITHTENEITLKIPWFYHEEMTIDFNNLDRTTWDLELYGMIPIFHSFESVQQIKVIDENIAYLKNGGSIYKSIDGFHNWTPIFEGRANHFFFLNEMIGWITEEEDGEAKIYYTEDGGNSFELQNTFSLPNTSDFIRKIWFSSENKGYFVTSGLQMFVIENNTFKNIFEYFPNLNNQQFMYDEIWDFSILNDDLLFILTNWPEDPLIKIDNQNITLSSFESGIIKPPQFIDNIGFILSNQHLYKSEDNGSSWTKIKSFENFPRSINFIDNQHGFIYIENGPNPPYFNETFDGGVTWKKYYTFTRYATSYHIGDFHDFSTTNGLVGSGRSLFKYIE